MMLTQQRPLGSSRAPSRPFPPRCIFAIGGAILVAAPSCRPASQAGVDVQQRSRELTRHLYAGTLDSLAKNAILDLGGPGDTVLVRWFLDRRRDSLEREWPTDPLRTVEGPQGGPTFLERLEATYGRELETVDEAVYPCYYPLYGLPHSLEYNRIARFSRYGDHTVTMAWLWTNDTLVGGWLIPSRRAVPSAFETYEAKTTLRLPFDAEWVVLWGGTKPHENYHVAIPPLRFAYDFVVDSGGSLHRTDGRSNADFYCWGRPTPSRTTSPVSRGRDIEDRGTSRSSITEEVNPPCSRISGAARCGWPRESKLRRATPSESAGITERVCYRTCTISCSSTRGSGDRFPRRSATSWRMGCVSHEANPREGNASSTRHGPRRNALVLHSKVARRLLACGPSVQRDAGRTGCRLTSAWRRRRGSLRNGTVFCAP
jgi:hypothetical protein